MRAEVTVDKLSRDLENLLCRERPDDAYSFYSSLLERLISFEFALDDHNRR